MKQVLKPHSWGRVFLLLFFLFFGVLASAATTQKGSVKSGGKALVGATVKLYVAGERYRDSAVLLGQAVTGKGGQFKIQYDPPPGASPVLYLVSSGGAVKKDDSAVEGAAITLATVLGSARFPGTVRLNERTTVATAYTMAQFLEGESISGPSPGVPNAAGIFRNLVKLQGGAVAPLLAKPPNGHQTDTLAAFNTLANMLAVCVQQQSNCDALFELAAAPNGERPTDTLKAVQNIALYPYQRPRLLYAYSQEKTVYKPVLSNAPVAWTLALRYVGNGKELDGPGFIAFDQQGSAWIANNYVWKKGTKDPKGIVCGSPFMLRFTPTGEDAPGAPYSGGGLNGAGFGILVDKFGSVWQGNFGFAGSNCKDKEEVLALAHSVTEMDADGNALSPDNLPGQPGGYSGNGTIFGPQGMSSDPGTGDIWIANCRNNNRAGNTVTVLQGGVPTSVKSFTPFDPVTPVQRTPEYLPKPFGITVDPEGTAWVAGNNINQVAGIRPDGTRVALFGKKDEEEGVNPSRREINRPMGIASDSAGGIWVANSGVVDIACGYQLTETGDAIEGEDSTFTSLQASGVLDENGRATDTNDGALASIALITKAEGGEGYELQRFATRGGAIMPWGVALDGNDNVWIANFDGQRLSHLCGQNTASCPEGKQSVGAAISPDNTGYAFNGLVRNTGVSIDPSGNVWLTNNWLLDPIQTNPGGREVVVFLGMAKPVTTPLLGYPRP